MDALDIAFDAKGENATEVHTYLTNNFTRYLTELLSHVLTDAASEDDRDFILATAIDTNKNTKTKFLASVQRVNDQMMHAMNKKLKDIKDQISNVVNGRRIQHQHDEKGRVALDSNGNKIILAYEIKGFVTSCLEVQESLDHDLEDVIAEQAASNSAANAAVGDADHHAADWLDEATHNELAILADFLEKGFAFHVDTTDFVQHTTHPYAPFSTGAYNELVDQINGFEQFFHYWKRTRERALDTLGACKAQEKASVSAEVFEVDIPALEAAADGLLLGTSGAEHDAQVAAEGDLSAAKAADTAAREALEARVTAGKVKIFREIGFQVKKLYRATRDEYKERIKEALEAAVDTFNDKLLAARAALVKIHEESTAAE